MMHPAWRQAMNELEKDKINEAKKMSDEKEQNLEEQVILTEREKIELNKILEDNYARGAFMGMCTNLFFSKLDTEDVLGIDRVIQIALSIRLKAYEMVGKYTPPPKPGSKPKPKVKLVM